ncbi:hypothetical protein [Archangium primigenium]|uniref:hypothetical protein n=1 Tax=[Archangium] primigenium TaxID=2792470 RepID=UPI00195996C6|nr:hypothetical protein [Archangium primigenium]MBM7118726.1 hypothetical protein [Archangium primigenium]
MRRSFGTSARPPLPETDNIDAFTTLMNKYWEAKASRSQEVKNHFVATHLSEFFTQLTESGKLTPFAFNDGFVMLSYLSLKKGLRFDAFLDGEVAEFFGGAKTGASVEFTLVESYTQSLSPEALADLPWSVQPGTAVFIFQARCGSRTRNIATFRGTNSVGKGRDALLGYMDSTGALANCSPDEIGGGCVKYWLSCKDHPIAKYADKIDLVIGHSLGAALAQDYTEEVLLRTRLAPLGYFAAAPRRNRAPCALWLQNIHRFFYPWSAQDPVTRGGTRVWPGMELRFSWLDAPVLPGLIDSGMDRVFSQHGALIGILDILTKGNRPRLAERRGTEISAEISALDEIDLGPFGNDFADVFRPHVVRHAFSPTTIEFIMRTLEDYGIDKQFGKGKTEKRGPVYGEFVHLVAELMAESPLFGSHFQSDPYTTLWITSQRMHTLCKSEETLSTSLTQLIEALVNGVETHIMVDAFVSGGRDRTEARIRQARRSFEKHGIITL